MSGWLTWKQPEKFIQVPKMTNQEFKYWMNGYLALSDESYLTKRQVEIIKNHAALVEATVGITDPEIQKLILLIQKEFQQETKICIEKVKENFKVLTFF